MEILKTEDYNKFVTIVGNRTISERKVDRIISDVEKGLNLFPYCPIIVTEGIDMKLNIIDGQHRFTACKRIGTAVYYVVAPDIKLRDIARMNSNTDKWKNEDFLGCYIRLEVPGYKELQKFIKQYKVQYRIAIRMLMYGNVKGGGRDIEEFKDGLFVLNHLEYGENLIKKSDALFARFSFYRDVNLIHAVDKLNKKGLWDFDKAIEKMDRHFKMMDKQTNSRNYILLIEQIYNMGSQTRKIIY